MKRLTQELPESKAADILSAAEHLFARHGYDGVSMNAVAQEAGVSKANVFHHFGSKEELYLAVLKQVRRELTRDLAAVSATPGDHLGENLARVGQLYMHHFLANEDRIRIFMRETLEKRPGQSKALAEKVFSQDQVALASLMQAAQERGDLRAGVDPLAPMALLMAACTFYFQYADIMSHMPGTATLTDPDRFIHQAVDILLHGIAARTNV